MKLWIVEEHHIRHMGGWTDRYLVNAETKEDAESAIDAENLKRVSAKPVDMERLEKEPWHISDSSEKDIFYQDAFDVYTVEGDNG